MKFDFDKCRAFLHKSLMTVLQKHGTAIRGLHESEDIWALSFDIIPWQPFAALSFRAKDESQGDLRYDVGGWRHHEFLGDINEPLLKKVAEYSREIVSYPDSDDDEGTSSQEAAHLLYLATATALLESDVAMYLNSLGINAPNASNTLSSSYFEFIVFDEDKCLKANYCEIVRANRVTKRLLQGKEYS